MADLGQPSLLDESMSALREEQGPALPELTGLAEQPGSPPPPPPAGVSLLPLSDSSSAAGSSGSLGQLSDVDTELGEEESGLLGLELFGPASVPLSLAAAAPVPQQSAAAVLQQSAAAVPQQSAAAVLQQSAAAVPQQSAAAVPQSASIDDLLAGLDLLGGSPAAPGLEAPAVLQAAGAGAQLGGGPAVLALQQPAVPPPESPPPPSQQQQEAEAASKSSTTSETSPTPTADASSEPFWSAHATPNDSSTVLLGPAEEASGVPATLAAWQSGTIPEVGTTAEGGGALASEPGGQGSGRAEPWPEPDAAAEPTLPLPEGPVPAHEPPEAGRPAPGPAHESSQPRSGAGAAYVSSGGGVSLLEAAERLERRLASGAQASPSGGASECPGIDAEDVGDVDVLAASLLSQLEGTEDGAGARTAGGGGGDAADAGNGGLGELAAARVFASHQFEQLFRGQSARGVVCCLAKYLGVVAVGTSGGAAYVLAPGGGGGGKGSPSPGPPRLGELAAKPGPGTPQPGAVTALAVSQHGGGLLLAAGHASGVVRLWELKSGLSGGLSWALAKSLTGLHGAPVTAAALCDATPGGATWLLTADGHGRLVCHSVGRHLSVAAQALTSFARQLTGGGGAAPASSLVTTLEAGGRDPGVICAVAPLARGREGGGADASPLLYVPELGHFVLVVAARAVLLCVLSPDGRLVTLHALLPPANAPAEALPYAAWRCSTPGEGPSNLGTPSSGSTQALHGSGQTAPARGSGGGGGGGVAATLAVAWGQTVLAYSVQLARPRQPAAQGRRPPQAGPAAQSPPALPPPALLRCWAAPGPVCGLAFLESGPLLVASLEGSARTLLQVLLPEAYAAAPGASGEEAGGAGPPAERILLRDWLVGSQAASPSTAAYHSALAASGEQLLLLGSQAVHVLQLLTWQQRLSALAAGGRLARALAAAVRVYHTAASAAASQMEPKPGGSGAGGNSGAWPADGRGAAPAEVARQLLSVLCAHVDATLHTLRAAPEARQAWAQARDLADVAIRVCLLVEAPAALYSDIFPRFDAAALGGAFLERLQPRLLADRLPGLPPEVMQRLVEHYAIALGRPEAVEAAVLRMEPAALDLNQLIPLCVRHGLYSALADIFSRALRDRLTPCTLLLVAAAAAAERWRATGTASGADVTGGGPAEEVLRHEDGTALGYRLLVLLHCCLAGQRFPPGLGGLPLEDAQAARLAALAFLLRSTPLGLWECWRLWGDASHADGSDASGAPAKLPVALQGPYPALRYLCQLDAAATLSTLAAALSSWDAMLSEVDAAAADWAGGRPALADDTAELYGAAGAGGPGAGPPLSTEGAGAAEGGTGGKGERTATQGMVDAVVALLRSGAAFAGEAERCAALEFLARHLAASRAAVPPSMLLHVLSHLAALPAEPEPERPQLPEPAQLPAAAPAAPSAPRAAGAAEGGQAEGPGAMGREEREAVFCEVVAHAGPLREVDRQQAVWLARRAGFARAEAAILHAQGQRAQALAVLAADSRHPAAAFAYAREALAEERAAASSTSGAGTARAVPLPLEAALLRTLPALVRLDAQRTAQLVAECLPAGQQQEALASLATHPELQFAFLRGALAASGELRPAGGTAGPGSNDKGSDRAAGGQHSVAFGGGGGRGALRPLLGQPGPATLYVKLLCQFDPEAVLPFLQAHDAYSVDDCLAACLAHSARAGAAFLLERRGDVRSALRIHIETVERANRELVAAVRRGDVPVALPSGRRGSAGGPPRLSALGALPLAPPPRAADVPPAAKAAQEALDAAISMCLRYSQDSVGLQGAAQLAPLWPAPVPAGPLGGPSPEGQPGGPGAPQQPQQAADPAQALWLEVLRVYIDALRVLRQEERAGERAAAAAAAGTADAAGAWVAAGDGGGEEPSRQRAAYLQALFTGYVEAVIGAMAGHVGLASIADAIMARYGADRFGDFRATLLGLLSACAGELGTLRCAARVVGADGAAALTAGYRACTAPLRVDDPA